jgi:hypothetical protein
MDNIQTGENVRVVVAGDYGSITVQVVDAAYSKPRKQGYAEIRQLTESLKARLDLTYTRILLGAIVVNHEDCLVGLITGYDQETGHAIMNTAYGFERSLTRTVEKFTQFLQNNTGIKVVDFLANPDVYDNMRWSTGVRPLFSGISLMYLSGRSGGPVLYAIHDTITADGLLQERTDYSGKESTVESPASRCSDLVRDYAVNKSAGYGTLIRIGWKDGITGEDVSITGSDTALDEALCRAGDKITLEILWSETVGGNKTKSYIVDPTEKVFDLVNGQRIERDAVDLPHLAIEQSNQPFEVVFPSGTIIDNLDEFKMCFRIVAGGGAGDYEGTTGDYRTTGVYPLGGYLADWYVYPDIGAGRWGSGSR